MLISELHWRYEKLHEVSSDFDFLSGHKLSTISVFELQKAAVNLALKYESDLNAIAISSEILSFKQHAISIFPNIKSASILDVLKLIHNYSLTESYPNLEVASRIFLTIPVTVGSCERSFNKLRLIKNYLKSSLSQEKLSNMGILSIENEICKDINFDKIIDDFAAQSTKSITLNEKIHFLRFFTRILYIYIYLYKCINKMYTIHIL